MAPCPPLKTFWAAAAGCNSKDSWEPQQVAILRIPKLTDGTLSTPQNPLGSRRNWRMGPCPPLKTLWAAAAGCNSRNSETDGWHLVRPSKASGQPADCNSSDSETDGWHPVRPSKPSGQPQQVASLGIPRLTDGALGSRGCYSRDSETDGWHPVHPSAGCNSRDSLSTPQNPLGSRSRLQF